MKVLEKIESLRKERNWSIYQLANESGLTQSTLTNMFKRGTCPTIDTLEKICSAFGVSLSEFFDDNQEKIYANRKEIDFINKYRSLNDNEKKAVSQLINTLLNK